MTEPPTSTETGVSRRFRLDGRVIAITGGGGLLGARHAEAVSEMGGIPILLDKREDASRAVAKTIAAAGGQALGIGCDITNADSIATSVAAIIGKFGRIDGLINNAANDPKVEAQADGANWSRFENFPLSVWTEDIAVGLTGAFLCAQAFGREMARRGSGVIVNIASDLAVIAPDQRIYRKVGLAAQEQPAKPVSYSVVKTGLLGLTRYLATYWAEAGIRVNALSPGGVFNGQDAEFLSKLTDLIPLSRMARADEYKAAIVFLLSDASSYMTGSNVVIDGGRSVW